MKVLIRDLFTEPNGSTWCPARVAVGLAAVSYHLAILAGLTLGQIRLDISTLGQYLNHLTLLIGAGTGAVCLKSRLGGDAP
jgi:hypothetical protein